MLKFFPRATYASCWALWKPRSVVMTRATLGQRQKQPPKEGDSGQRVVSFAATERRVLDGRILSVAALIRHENREVRCLVKFHTEIQNVRAVCSILVQKYDGGCILCTAEQPAASRCTVLVRP